MDVNGFAWLARLDVEKQKMLCPPGSAERTEIVNAIAAHGMTPACLHLACVR